MSDEDIGAIIVSKEEADWTNTRDECQRRIDAMRKEIIINETIIALSNNKIVEVKNGK